MATVFLQRGKWTLGYMDAGKFVRRTLGEVSEERAREILAEFNSRGAIQRLDLPLPQVNMIYWKTRDRAKLRSIPFELTHEQYLEMYYKADARCQISGIAFSDYLPAGATKRPWYPSIDRIDSLGPYTKDNCRLVCVAVNMALGEWGLDILKAVAHGVVLGKPGATVKPRGKIAKLFRVA